MVKYVGIKTRKIAKNTNRTKQREICKSMEGNERFSETGEGKCMNFWKIGGNLQI